MTSARASGPATQLLLGTGAAEVVVVEVVVVIDAEWSDGVALSSASAAFTACYYYGLIMYSVASVCLCVVNI